MQGATDRTAAAIQGIQSTIGNVSEIAIAIASAVEEQGAATGEIANNVQQAAMRTETVSNNIGNVSEAARQTRATATRVQGEAGDLSGQAVKLKQDVASFLTTIRAT